jgi:L-ascorbate metabolism protein UlaG (beta-lactamase superfamily)
VPGADRIRWLGHGSVLVELDGARIVVDPVLRTRVAHLRRHAPLPAELPSLDAILITHRHLDHLDLPTLARLPREIPVIAPHAAAPLLRRRGFSQVIGSDVGDATGIGAVQVIAVRADHDGGRVVRRTGARALGYVIEGSRRVYVAGDTGLFDEMADLRPLHGAAIPVWGWGPTLGPGHMGPEDAAQAVALLDPALAVPIHYGTYAPYGMAAPSREPAERFARLVAEGPTSCRVEILDPGRSVEIRER